MKKSKLVLLQFYCLILYTSGLTIFTDKNVHFVWSNDVGLENAVKTIEIANGNMFHPKLKYILNKTSQQKNTSDKFKALWINNTINTHIPQILEEFKNITDVRIENTDLSQFDENVLKRLTNIKRLYLGRNIIGEVTRDALTKLIHLEILCLNNNKINSLDDRTLERTTELRKINLSYNNLKEISSDLFSNNRQLQEIYLEGNKLQIIAENAFENLNLKALTLAWNDCIDMSTFSYEKNINELLLEVRENCKKN
ncbi:hypothetical protein PVAND_000556 [Polypedilum vanderplanki]|uniref:Uncharacterized protein n=1 Tax=Polypedilum vanderplanki TaxID=319348 RepID=A0A9J6BKY2_POLVA|nr:hypothetical protein PVAND_000556 [Polypedilum vanderplanki]